MAKKDRGLGLAALVSGRRSPVERARNLADVRFSLGPNRPNRPNSRITDTIRSAVRDVLGPGYSVTVTSGTENRGKQYGSTRHKTGLAADFAIVDPAGNRLNAWDNRRAMTDVAQAIAAKGGLGIGLGTGYMGGNAIHADTVAPGPGQDHEWGNIGNAMAGTLRDARNFSLMPASFYDRSLPSIGAPTPFSSTQPNPNSLRPSMLDGIPAAGVNGVQRAPLGPVSMPSTPAASPGFSGALMSPTSLSSLSPSAISSMAAQTAPRGPMSAPVARAPNPANIPSTATLAPSPMASTPLSPVSSQFAPPSPSELASAYAQMGQTLQQAGVNLAGTALPAPNAAVAMPTATMPNMPVAMPPAPVQQLAPPPVQQMPPPRQVVPQSLPSAFPDTPPAPPQFSPADIYGGQVGTAQASGGNTVGRDPFGRTTVTNQYGVTTAMTPDGKQSAYGGAPGMPGPSSIFGGGQMGPKAGGILGGILGAAAGTAVAGPMGGIVGGLLGKSMLGSPPGGSLFGGNRSNFGSGRTASEAEANRGGRGVTAGGTGLW